MAEVETLEAEVRHNQRVHDLLAAGSITVWEAAKRLIAQRYAGSEPRSER